MARIWASQRTHGERHRAAVVAVLGVVAVWGVVALDLAGARLAVDSAAAEVVAAEVVAARVGDAAARWRRTFRITRRL